MTLKRILICVRVLVLIPERASSSRRRTSVTLKRILICVCVLVLIPKRASSSRWRTSVILVLVRTLVLIPVLVLILVRALELYSYMRDHNLDNGKSRRRLSGRLSDKLLGSVGKERRHIISWVKSKPKS